MAKGKSRRGAKSVQFAVTLDTNEAPWAAAVERVAREHGKSLDQAISEALRDWLWQASGLKRLFEQVREAGELMTRSFQVEGMLTGLARSAGISMGQQTEYVKRAQDERDQFIDQRKKVARLVREIRKLAEETQLPGAVEAANKLVVPD
jgi:hypothetical protein